MQRIDGMRSSGLLALCFVVSTALPATAQDQQYAQDAGPVPARMRHFEGTVTVQRASAGETSAAIPNLPLDAGDRVWTDADGRAELMLSDGSTLWLDTSTTFDIVALQDQQGNAGILRLWGGAALLWRPAGAQLAELRVDNGDNIVVIPAGGLVRLDVDDARRLWVSVYQGNASLAAGGMIEQIGAGQQTYTEAGSSPALAAIFSTADIDEFGQWQQRRWSDYADTTRHVAQREYIPDEVRPYASELESTGSWFYYDDFGSYAWRPTVSIDWSPYNDGRWIWGTGGWAWASRSSWGWATSHYGRWHHLPAQGWVWFPGAVYRPAWVSWYVGYGHVGWSPLGYYNRPFLSINLWFGGGWGYGNGYHGGYGYQYPSHYGNGGRAVAGQGYARGDTGRAGGWTLIDAADFGRGDSARRAVSRSAIPAGAAQNGGSMTGTLRHRSVSALAASGTATRSAINRSSTGSRGSLGQPARTGSLSGVAGSRPTGGTLNGRAILPRSSDAAGESLGTRSVDGAGGRPPGTSVAGGRDAGSPRSGGATVRSRPGGLSSGLSRSAGDRTSLSRPVGGARQPIGGARSGVAQRSGSGRSMTTPSSALGHPSVTSRGTTYSRPSISTRRGESSSSSRSVGTRRPQIAPRGAGPSRSSVGRPSAGSRPSTPRGGSGVGRSGSGSRGGSRGAVSRGSARRR